MQESTPPPNSRNGQRDRRRGPRLRVHDPERQRGFWDLSEETPLSRIFDREFVPVKLVRASEKTITLYRESIAWWRLLTGDPPLREISHRTTAEFARSLTQANCGRVTPKRMAPMTQRKHCKNLNAVFRFTGPPEWKRKNLGLVTNPPWIEEPPMIENPPGRDFTVEEVRLLVAACDGMRTPKFIHAGESRGKLDAAAWWRGLIVAAYYTGLRIGTLKRLEWSMLDGEFATIGAEHFKGGRRGRRIYFHPEAIAQMEAIRATSQNRGREVFPWPHCTRYFVTCFDRLAAAALPEPRRFSFHSFRRTHLTVLRRVSADLDRATEIARESAGHSDPRTTEGFYLNASDKELLLVQAMQRMPSPLPQ